MKRREFNLKVLKLVGAGGLAAQWLDAGRMAVTAGRAEVRIKRLMPCFTGQESATEFNCRTIHCNGQLTLLGREAEELKHIRDG